jgi:hypothetical protein
MVPKRVRRCFRIPSNMVAKLVNCDIPGVTTITTISRYGLKPVTGKRYRAIFHIVILIRLALLVEGHQV